MSFWGCLQGFKGQCNNLTLPARPAAVRRAVHAARLQALHNLILNRSLATQFTASPCQFTGLRTLELSSGEADWAFPYRRSVHFESRWVSAPAASFSVGGMYHARCIGQPTFSSSA